MVGVLRRMNRLKASILDVRVGPGAAILPSEVTRIHMEFAKQGNNGQFGPRKFWRNCLPRLKYWNPAIPMIVNRVADTTGPATMTIYFRQSSAAAPPSSTTLPIPTFTHQPTSSSFMGMSRAPEPEDNERAVRIDMKNQHSDAILADFLAKTGAVPVEPTPKEVEELEEIHQRVERGKVDRVKMKAYLDEQRREEARLAQAKQEADAIKQEVI